MAPKSIKNQLKLNFRAFLWSPKRPSKFDLFSHRFFIDFGSVLASNMGPSWEPRRLKIRINSSQKSSRSSPRAFLIRSSFRTSSKSVLASILGGQGSIFKDFSMIFRASWLTLGMFSAALAGGATPPQTPPLLSTKPRIQEPAEDKAEKKNPYGRLQQN